MNRQKHFSFKKSVALNHLTRIFLGVLAAALFLGISSCRSRDNETITIAEQYGLAYAPLQIMKEKRFLEILAPETEVRWVQMGNTAAIREAVVAGRVDAGFMGIPPFLIGSANGMKWKIISGLSQSPLGLVGDSRRLSGIESMDPGVKIALPQPGSIQHILLSMAMERKTGNAKLLDNQLVTLNHPDGMAALLSGSVDAHFTAPPYLFQETETTVEGENPFRILLSGDEAFGGEFTFIVAMATDAFLDSRPELAEKFRTALKQGVDFLNENPAESAGILGRVYGLEPDLVLDYLSREGMIFTTRVKGLEEFILFMTRQGYLKKTPSVREVLSP